ncbi:MAG TPA: hypothetical protein VMN58_12420 [Acidimicrobiales bacterium]|nr:hypothetical protein [Acidimicrobiales bacterium]
MTMQRSLVIAAAIALLAVLAPSPSQATSPEWAPAATAPIHPGVQTRSDSGQCTSNFVFYAGSEVYIGQSAHCTGLGAATDTNGCNAGSLPLGSEVRVGGATEPGTLAYSSWLTMQRVDEGDTNTCRYNDFALVRLDPADHGRVNPSIPVYGGPVALGATTSFGEDVYSYGNSSLRFGIHTLSPKTGVSLGQGSGDWNHPVYTASPGIPGDSGSAFLSSDGSAMGSLSTLALAPLAGSNGVTDLDRAVAYLHAHGGLGEVQLALGTEPFRPSLVGLVPLG